MYVAGSPPAALGWPFFVIEFGLPLRKSLKITITSLSIPSSPLVSAASRIVAVINFAATPPSCHSTHKRLKSDTSHRSLNTRQPSINLSTTAAAATATSHPSSVRSTQPPNHLTTAPCSILPLLFPTHPASTNDVMSPRISQSLPTHYCTTFFKLRQSFHQRDPSYVSHMQGRCHSF